MTAAAAEIEAAPREALLAGYREKRPVRLRL
jgi:hypothetical protein